MSRVVGARLVDVAAHALRDSLLAADTSYLIDEFPVTKAVLEKLETGSISFLDNDLDRSEAFVLRDLEMSCALLMPLVVDGRAWGLVELYDMRLRRYTREQQAIAEFLVGVAAHRLEALGDDLNGTRATAALPRSRQQLARPWGSEGQAPGGQTFWSDPGFGGRAGLARRPDPGDRMARPLGVRPSGLTRLSGRAGLADGQNPWGAGARNRHRERSGQSPAPWSRTAAEPGVGAGRRRPRPTARPPRGAGPSCLARDSAPTSRV